jgi:hypothetical protein
VYLVGLPFLGLIVVYWLFRRRKTLGKLDFAVAVVFMVASLISIIPNYHAIKHYVISHLSQNPTLSVVLILLILAVISIFYCIITYRIFKALLLLFYRFKTKFDTEIVLDKSNIYLGGSLVFEAKFSAWLNHGFIVTRIQTQFGEYEEIFVSYDKTTKLGKLNKKYTDRILNWKWKIPSNFSNGKYTISIILYDIEDIFWYWKNKNIMKFTVQTIVIKEPPKKTVEIQKIMKPSIKTIKSLELNTKPMSGWICVKVYNDTDIEHGGCYGEITTDNKKFQLYDYEEFLKNGKNQDIDPYATFSLEPKSTKRLYADIKTDTDLIKISLDIGKEEIVKELPLKFDS